MSPLHVIGIYAIKQNKVPQQIFSENSHLYVWLLQRLLRSVNYMLNLFKQTFVNEYAYLLVLPKHQQKVTQPYSSFLFRACFPGNESLNYSIFGNLYITWEFPESPNHDFFPKSPSPNFFFFSHFTIISKKKSGCAFIFALKMSSVEYIRSLLRSIIFHTTVR